MYNYPIQDMSGHVIGAISLETEDIPKAMMDDAKFDLGVEYQLYPRKRVRAFMLIPKLSMPTDNPPIPAEIAPKPKPEPLAYPINCALAGYHEHMHVEHHAVPGDYGMNVLGWHRRNFPECETLPSFKEAQLWGAQLLGEIRKTKES
jgi:hypothetical protein